MRSFRQMQLQGGPSVILWPRSAIHVGRDGRVGTPGMYGPGISHVLRDSRFLYHEATPDMVADGDTVLVPLVSYHDVLNMFRYRHELSRARVIVGGPACINIKPYASLISAANYGRCDCGKIDRIIDGDPLPSVWTADDQQFLRTYDVDCDARLAPWEKGVGCRRKCRFCFYSWWNRFQARSADAGYHSGYRHYEDCWDTLDWSGAVRGAVTALDGFTEASRRQAGKPISCAAITEKLLEADQVPYNGLLRLKLYMIAGYPWETIDDLRSDELVRAFSAADRRLRHARIVVRLHISHFIPFPKTPLWSEPFNSSVNARDWAIERPILYSGEHITVHTGGLYAPHPASAAASCAVMRATADDEHALQVMAEPGWVNRPGTDRLRWLTEHVSHLLAAQTVDPLAHVKTHRENQLQGVA